MSTSMDRRQFIRAAAGTVAVSPTVLAQITKPLPPTEHTPTAPRRLRLAITEEYGKEVEESGNTNVPERRSVRPQQHFVPRTVSRLCALAGWSIAREGESCDTTLTITSTAHGLAAEYQFSGRNWTGAYVHGTIRVEKSGQIVFDRSFVGHVPPQAEIPREGAQGDFAFEKCIDAYEFSFLPAFLDAVAATFGPDALVLECGHHEDQIEDGFSRDSPAAYALLRMGEPAIPALLRAEGRMRLSPSQYPLPSYIDRSDVVDACRSIAERIRIGAAIDYQALSKAFEAGSPDLMFTDARLFAMTQSGLHRSSQLPPAAHNRIGEVRSSFDESHHDIRDIRDTRMIPFLERGALAVHELYLFAQQTRDLRFVDPLIEALRRERPDGNGRLWAASGLESITGQDLGLSKYTDANAWASWWAGYSGRAFDRMTGWAG